MKLGASGGESGIEAGGESWIWNGEAMDRSVRVENEKTWRIPAIQSFAFEQLDLFCNFSFF